jgi:hypothetical protein
MNKRCILVLSAAVVMGSLPGIAIAQGGREPPVSFAEDVLPVLKVHCAACHTPGGEGTTASGLDLTTYQGVMKGTKFGPMVVPGNPDTSNLMLLLDWRVSPQLRMPHDKKQLPVGERTTIRTWIRQGAKDN